MLWLVHQMMALRISKKKFSKKNFSKKNMLRDFAMPSVYLDHKFPKTDKIEFNTSCAKGEVWKTFDHIGPLK